MELARVVRAIGGLLAIVTLLGLISADFFYSSLMLENDTIALLLLIIGALLGVDTLIEKSLSISIEKEKEENKND